MAANVISPGHRLFSRYYVGFAAIALVIGIGTMLPGLIGALGFPGTLAAMLTLGCSRSMRSAGTRNTSTPAPPGSTA